jgi:hypothetical protein
MANNALLVASLLIPLFASLIAANFLPLTRYFTQLKTFFIPTCNQVLGKTDPYYGNIPNWVVSDEDYQVDSLFSTFGWDNDNT